MSEAATETITAETAGETSADTSTEASTTAAETEQIEGYEALGDAGKQALDRMKAERDAALAAAKEAKGDPKAAERIKADREALAKANEALAAMQAKIDGREAEYAAEQSKREIEQTALAKANERILKAELRVAGKGKLTDPSDLFRFPEIVDLSAFEVGANGEVDAAALEAAVNDLITKRPDLAVQDGKRFQGGADGGTRKESGKSVDDQIADAQKAGDIQTVVALKQQRSAELLKKS